MRDCGCWEVGRGSTERIEICMQSQIVWLLATVRVERGTEEKREGPTDGREFASKTVRHWYGYAS
jgi:hypothetical protein